jgi:hypothetical protein
LTQIGVKKVAHCLFDEAIAPPAMAVFVGILLGALYVGS